MKVLVLGGGGREHAIAWRLASDPVVSRVFCAPGNAGIAQVASTVALDPGSPRDVVAFVEEHQIDLTVIGPELPLTRGVADVLAARRCLVFGPTKAAAEIESSKVFAKEFMSRHGVPTADYAICSNADEAARALESGRFGFPVVLKADGLAAGKGVIVAEDRAAARLAVETIMVARQFGAAGDRLLVEQCLEGSEVSVFAISDGTRAIHFGSAQDHKRAFDGDRGPNTGGMGAFAPSPLLDAALRARIDGEIIQPTIDGLREEGRPFRGFLYAGLMLTVDGPKVLEFNARLGDPESQVVLPLLAGEFAPVLREAAAGELNRSDCRFSADVAVGVVLASGGYPDRYQTGKPISGLESASAEPGALVFHAGTAIADSRIVTSGGRVLTVVGSGTDYPTAMERAYAAAGRISFEGMYCRRDIGRKAVAREVDSR